MDAAQLQREVLRLQTRIQQLIALLRVLVVVLKISRFSLNQTRLPDGHDKRSLLRVIDRRGRPFRCDPCYASSGCRRRDTIIGTARSSVRSMTGHRLHEFPHINSRLPRSKRSVVWQYHLSTGTCQPGHWLCWLNALARSLLRRAPGIG